MTTPFFLVKNVSHTKHVIMGLSSDKE